MHHITPANIATLQQRHITFLKLRSNSRSAFRLRLSGVQIAAQVLNQMFHTENLVNFMNEDVVLEFDKPHFTVRLDSTFLKVDLKEGIKKDLEKLVEAKPAIRDSLGLLFQSVIPLDVRLRDIRSVSLDKKGRVKIDIPSRKDLTIPLDEQESKNLIDKLNELIPLEKERAIRDSEVARKTEKSAAPGRAIDEREVARGRID